MIALVQPQLLQIDQLLGEESGQKLDIQKLKQICLLGAYVKRRVNLALICDKKAVVRADELTHCLRESLTYLTQYGAVCALHQEGTDSVCSCHAQSAYDFFEDCLEAALPSLSALWCAWNAAGVFHSPDDGRRGRFAECGQIQGSGEDNH